MAAQAAFINNLLEAAFGGDTYTGGTIKMGLFKTGLPSTTGVEVSSGSYARQTLSFAAAASKSIAAAQVTFTDISTSDTVVAYGIYDGTTLIDEKLLDTPYTPDTTSNELKVTYSFNLAA